MGLGRKMKKLTFLIFLLCLGWQSHAIAADVTVLFLGGQSNASEDLRRSIIKIAKRRLGNDFQIEVCRSNRGGTHSSFWIDDSGNRGERWFADVEKFQDCLKSITDAGDVPRIIGYVWWQGERDALGIEGGIESYKNRHRNFTSSVFSEYNSLFGSYLDGFKMIDVLIGYNNLAFDLTDEIKASVGFVRESKRCLAAESANVMVIESQHHPRLDENGVTDLWHIADFRLDSFSGELLDKLDIR